MIPSKFVCIYNDYIVRSVLSVTSHFLDETVVLLANNVKDLVAIGKVQTLYEGNRRAEF